jgi:phosphodiesterase/alkaline phosphatase D-like protein
VLTRRRFVIGSLATGAVACIRSAVVRSPPPRLTHGVQSGDVQTGRALIWARCDEPARMVVEWDTSDRFARPQQTFGASSAQVAAEDIAASYGVPEHKAFNVIALLMARYGREEPAYRTIPRVSWPAAPASSTT